CLFASSHLQAVEGVILSFGDIDRLLVRIGPLASGDNATLLFIQSVPINMRKIRKYEAYDLKGRVITATIDFNHPVISKAPPPLDRSTPAPSIESDKTRFVTIR